MDSQGAANTKAITIVAAVSAVILTVLFFMFRVDESQIQGKLEELIAEQREKLAKCLATGNETKCAGKRASLNALLRNAKLPLEPAPASTSPAAVATPASGPAGTPPTESGAPQVAAEPSPTPQTTEEVPDEEPEEEAEPVQP